MPAGHHWQLGCANLPVRAACCLPCHSADAGVSVLLQSRMHPLVSLAEQEHILQHWGQHAAVQLADTVKNLRRHQCSQNVQFDVWVLWAGVKFCGLQGIVSLCLWMLFGKSTGERPGRCGVSMALRRSLAMYVFQKRSVPGLLVPLPPLPLFSKAVIFLAVALQHARCVLTSAGTCG